MYSSHPTKNAAKTDRSIIESGRVEIDAPGLLKVDMCSPGWIIIGGLKYVQLMPEAFRAAEAFTCDLVIATHGATASSQNPARLSASWPLPPAYKCSAQSRLVFTHFNPEG